MKRNSYTNYKFVLLFPFCLLLFSALRAQSFSVGHRTEVFVDSSRANRSIDAEVYYPADVAGDNVAFTSASDLFPVLAFGHGFVMTWDAYQNIWEAVVPNGYIMIFPKTEGTISPSHEQFGLDLAFLIREMHRLNSDNASFYFQHVDSMDGVMGHSMGGGASFLAMASDTSIRSMALLAPAETNPSAISAASFITAPSLIFAGENDCVTPPASNQIPMYDSLQSDCKDLITILGGSHCQMANSNFLCSIGESSCSPAPTISRADQHLAISRYLIPWLNYTLKNDCQSGLDFENTLQSDATVTAVKNCSLCSLNQISSISALSVVISPNPLTSDILQITIPESVDHIASFLIVSALGEIVYNGRLNSVGEKGKYALTLPDLKNGVYFLKADTGKESYTNRVVVLR